MKEPGRGGGPVLRNGGGKHRSDSLHIDTNSGSDLFRIGHLLQVRSIQYQKGALVRDLCHNLRSTWIVRRDDAQR